MKLAEYSVSGYMGDAELKELARLAGNLHFRRLNGECEQGLKGRPDFAVVWAVR